MPQYYTNQGASNIYDQVIYSLRDKGVPVDIVSHKQTITQPRSQGSLLPISRWWEMRLIITNCTHIMSASVPKCYLVTAMFGQGFEIKCIFFYFASMFTG